jgi:hypothetical protein
MDLKIFKIQKKFKKSEHQPNPDFYWKIVFFATSTAILFVITFGIHLFLVINKEEFSSAIDYKGQAQKISENRIGQVLDYYAGRADKSKQILNSPALVIDPSI